MAAKNQVTFLSLKNPHPRDKRITFDEDAHRYHVDGQPVPISVSGIVHAHFPVFDAEEIIDRYYTSWKENKKSPYNAMIKHCRLNMHLDDATIKREIKRMWNMYGNERADYGTGLHLSAELHLNEAPREDESIEYSQYLRWYNEARPKTWSIYRTEMNVFCEKAQVAGQLDALFQDVETKEFILCDWKCVNDLNKSSNEKGLPPFQMLRNTNKEHYTVSAPLHPLLRCLVTESASFPLRSNSTCMHTSSAKIMGLM
jgi:hypothetical protein